MTKRRAIITGVILVAASAAGYTLTPEQLALVSNAVDVVVGLMQ